MTQARENDGIEVEKGKVADDGPAGEFDGEAPNECGTSTKEFPVFGADNLHTGVQRISVRYRKWIVFYSPREGR